MDAFQAIVLICLATVPSEQCTERTALDVLSIGVANELACTMGWQELIARSAQAADIGKDSYVRTLCRRSGAR